MRHFYISDLQSRSFCTRLQEIEFNGSLSFKNRLFRYRSTSIPLSKMVWTALFVTLECQKMRMTPLLFFSYLGQSFDNQNYSWDSTLQETEEM